MAKLELTTEQEVTLQVAVKTATGKPAEIDGVPEWRVSDPTRARLLPREAAGKPDPFSVDLWIEDGAAGDLQVFCTVDADLGSGVRHLGTVFDVAIRSPEASTVAINAAEPVAKRELTDA